MKDIGQQKKKKRFNQLLLWQLSVDVPATMGNLEHHAHLKRTLDEAYYPKLPEEVLDDRNNDQVVSREINQYQLICI
jgi:hypothetical protein